MHPSENNTVPSRTSYSPARPYISRTALWSASTSPTGTPSQPGAHTCEYQLVMQSHPLTGMFDTSADHLNPFNQTVEPPIQQSFQTFAPTSYAPNLGHEKLGQTDQIRFICPWYTCGHLFTCLPQLVQHIPQHSTSACHPSPPQLYDMERNPLSEYYQASPSQGDEETAILLDVLKSSAALSTSSYSSPASATIEHRSTSMGAHNTQSFMLAPAPSIRKRGE